MWNGIENLKKSAAAKCMGKGNTIKRTNKVGEEQTPPPSGVEEDVGVSAADFQVQEQ